MKNNKKNPDYISLIRRKLIFLAIGTMLVYVFILYVFSLHTVHQSWKILLPVSLVPLGSFFIFYLKHRRRRNLADIVAHCKYPWFCPFIFFYDDRPEIGLNIKLKDFEQEILPGDLLFRRYDTYLDGLIFSQNSYFTHVGIYYGDYHEYKDQVLHATGARGVHLESLKDFCRCDDLVIMRFTLDETEEEVDVSECIKREYRTNKEFNMAELEIFNKLEESVLSNKDTIHGYMNVVLKRALSLVGTPYDTQFQFNEFSRLSCIEYVWYCYKCLFPLHRIQVIDFEYFKWIKIPVIVPDVFIKNDYFKLVYSSLKEGKSKPALCKLINTDWTQIRRFVVILFAWDLILLLALFLIFTYFKI